LSGGECDPLDLPSHQTQDSPATEVAGIGMPEIARLTRLMVAGDEAAYREFYDAYYGRLFRYLLVVACGDEEAAADALAATLARVVRHIKAFPNEEIFWSWLTVLARTAFADHTRKRRRYLAFLDRFTWQARLEETSSTSADAEARMQAVLEQSMAALPVEERQLMEWKYFERQSVHEIAQALDASDKAIESRLVRIRQKLKAMLLLGLKDE
jgi:RNA polymerase sigma-70 factor, ECF subfamily